MNPIIWKCEICGREMCKGKFRKYNGNYMQPCAECHRARGRQKNIRYPNYTVVFDTNRTYSPGAQFSQLDLDEGIPLHAFDGVTFKRSGRAFHVYGGKLCASPVTP